eukprot:CAMPEP_0197941110 /NCGR_PEP_ID=MMETSP1439-20131203/122292_1 /TAXON_ID=66791 /ORGANISM="Gonyaulax spinifera, Strain CCMP409" /LENGTH=33 /DNA_ID= /DNA_START= /DNA_END= /DNA_ORIENTATION=
MAKSEEKTALVFFMANRFQSINDMLASEKASRT